ncbi:MAG: hypothetical protein GTO13_10450 [Proteobacteria bacterium]|nr:hypothetical protein [Pseudomonadota bacterium]
MYLDSGRKKISESRLVEFCQEAFQKAGMGVENSQAVADTLVSANLPGVDSHGVVRVPSYIRRLLDKRVKPNPQIRAVRQDPSFVWLDGDCGLGLVVSAYAMKEAVALASQSGAGIAAVFNSDHFGAAAYYAMLALKHDMIGVAMTNAAAVMALRLLTLTTLRTPLPI